MLKNMYDSFKKGIQKTNQFLGRIPSVTDVYMFLGDIIFDAYKDRDESEAEANGNLEAVCAGPSKKSSGKDFLYSCIDDFNEALAGPFAKECGEEVICTALMKTFDVLTRDAPREERFFKFLMDSYK